MSSYLQVDGYDFKLVDAISFKLDSGVLRLWLKHTGVDWESICCNFFIEVNNLSTSTKPWLDFLSLVREQKSNIFLISF